MNNFSLLFIGPVIDKEEYDVYVLVISSKLISTILIYFYGTHFILHELYSFDLITLMYHIYISKHILNAM